ncbi:hypothetical protein F3Y22_tig00117002pilonHSYRG00030 [Hibiscus syriacus]|uniref:Uncharacterized protein n=1 Tax=Hibiscus syriacus TaxID=106335 RepID=A0A6A2XD55_HIBSY|nr:hypothetical protein F3Y22_tig00117002pilonHSYRG00030 [Hibiscus syriacus]
MDVPKLFDESYFSPEAGFWRHVVFSWMFHALGWAVVSRNGCLLSGVTTTWAAVLDYSRNTNIQSIVIFISIDLKICV